MSTSTASWSQNGRPNVHEPGDYPIILGESLKNEASSGSKYLRLRYNWEPQNGFTSQRGTLKRSNGNIQLAYTDDKSQPSAYDYKVTVPGDPDPDGDTQISQLALVFDPEKSVYVLEQLSQSLDLNLVSARDQSRDEVRRLRQINGSPNEGREADSSTAKETTDHDEDEADPSNPFDFRHFLSEAKENAEKAIPQPGSRTPVPGGRTPMSGISSPSLNANRFLPSNMSKLGPAPTSVPAPKKPTTSKSAVNTAPKKSTTVKRKPPATKPPTSQPLSNEVVSDSSDEDVQDTVAVSRRSPPPAPKERSHIRHTSAASVERSPNIIVTGDLEIDMGSPTLEPRRRVGLDRSDLEAFRSQTQTPTLPVPHGRRPPMLSNEDIEMRDPSEDENEYEGLQEVDADEDMDEDVEALVLPSPRSKNREDTEQEIEKAPSPPTPLPPAPDEDYDDLEAELEKELGFGMDDESEVSEEE